MYEELVKELNEARQETQIELNGREVPMSATLTGIYLFNELTVSTL